MSGLKTNLQLAVEEILQCGTKGNFQFDACQGCAVVRDAKALALPCWGAGSRGAACLGESGPAQSGLDERLTALPAADSTRVVRPKVRVAPRRASR
jgi:hypothetical protein